MVDRGSSIIIAWLDRTVLGRQGGAGGFGACFVPLANSSEHCETVFHRGASLMVMHFDCGWIYQEFLDLYHDTHFLRKP